MFQPRTALLFLLAVALVGCQGTTLPERRDVLGSWISKTFPGATVRMTLAETARAVDGAGSWLTVTESYGFDVSGAVAGDEVSLLLRFDTRPDINFQGFFTNADVMTGTLTGDGYRRADITFERQRLMP